MDTHKRQKFIYEDAWMDLSERDAQAFYEAFCFEVMFRDYVYQGIDALDNQTAQERGGEEEIRP